MTEENTDVFLVCREHIERGLEDFIDCYELAPDMSIMQEEINSPMPKCRYCADHAAYILSMAKQEEENPL